MPLLIMLVLMFLILALPIVLYNRWLKGKGGYINPGRQMGAKHWQDYNKPSDEEIHR
jgi:hypothetical protein